MVETQSFGLKSLSGASPVLFQELSARCRCAPTCGLKLMPLNPDPEVKLASLGRSLFAMTVWRLAATP
jgi:hypothetical protein